MTTARLFEKFDPITCLKKDDHSSVYLADHVFLGKQIILKTLDTSNLPDKSVLQRFQREAKILAKLENPHIIRVLDFGMYEQYFYISFEYFQSKNLRQRLRANSILPEQARNLMRQLFEGLKFAHRHSVIHRDIKPENVLVDESDHLKIADFGLALLLNEDTLTHKSTIVGTPGYMSPEQIQGEELTPQSDLFSAGLLTYELFEGKNPLVGGDVGKTINAILKVDASAVIAEATKLPQDIALLCERLLQRDKRKRPKDCEQVLNTLRSGVVVSENVTGFRFPGWLGMAFALALTAGLAVYMMSFSDSSQLSQPGIAEQAVEQVDSLDVATSSEITPDSLIIDLAGSIENDEVKPREIQRNIAPSPPVGDNENLILSSVTTNSKTDANNSQVDAKNMRGLLEIRCQPWADVYINDEKTDTTPLKNPLELPEGEYSVRLKNPYYPSFEKKISILAGSTARFAVNLDTLFGFLDYRVYPWGQLFVDDKNRGETPLKRPIALWPGKYKVTVRNPAFQDVEHEVTIARRDTLRKLLDFEQQ
ncbi:MAG: protein kinase domain-containing protein [Calditrichia bacterium]